MFDFLQTIFLSQYLLALLLVVLLMMVTSWARREQEYAGYVLGWLIGILIIIMLQTIPGTEPVPNIEDVVEETTEETTATDEDGVEISFGYVISASVFGISTGYAILFFMGTLNMSHRRRSMTIAIFTTLLVLGLYLVFSLSDKSSQILGVFALAFAIGALFNIVLNRTRIPTRFQASAALVDSPAIMPTTPYDPLENPPAADLRNQRKRFNDLRRQNRPPGS